MSKLINRKAMHITAANNNFSHGTTWIRLV